MVALEQAVAAPFATRQLADLGARVIKVERPGGGDFARGYDRSVHGQSSYFVWLNRGKESLELDIKSRHGQEVLHALLGRADVLVQNLAPGAVERAGFGAAGLTARYPALICCSVSGYGPDGPYAAKKAYDLLVQCEAGLVSVTGTPEEPAKAGISVADIAAGMYAFSGVLTALYERERTGRGGCLEVAMLDALGEWMMQPFYYSVYGGRPAQRTGARHASIDPYGPYPAAGGSQVFLGVQNDREWAILCHPGPGPPGPGDRCAVRHQHRPRRAPGRADRDHLRRAGRASRPGGWRRCWRRPGSPAPGCAPRPSSARTPSWRPGTGGARWARRAGRCARCCRRSACRAGRPRWARSRPSASTPPPSWPSWA